MELTPFTQSDFDTLYDFMQPLWLDTYGGFLPTAQIQLLLDKYFSPSSLQDFQKKGYRYYKIEKDGVLVFVEREEDVYIDKLYLSPSVRGKNYPALIFEWLAKLGKDLTLNVNQNNVRAVKCYKKNGFEVVEKQAIDLGNGMVNYDYFMKRKT